MAAQRSDHTQHGAGRSTPSQDPANRDRPVQSGHSAHGAHEQHGGHADHAGGHGGHAGHHADIFRRRFWLALILAIPVILFSETIQDWFNYSLPDFPGDGWVAPVLGTVVFFYGGMPFLSGAVDELRGRSPGMMTLIALAISVAFVASVASVLTDFDLEFWWELVTLIVIMLFGHWQEMRALGQARGALDALSALLPDEAERVTGTGTETVSIADLQSGDVVLIRPGARVPADGVIVEGRADLDESVITGESRPVNRGEGESVVAGAVVVGSALRVRIEATGEGTALAGIRRMIEEAQQSRSRAQVLADRAAALLFYVALGAGILTFLGWGIFNELDSAVVRTVGVLVIACPHALGLAIPLVISLATGLSARAGILVKDRVALERMRKVDTVLFDKTGTLTKGQHVVTGVVASDGNTNALLALAAAVESDSEHPLARAIVRRAGEAGADIPEASDFEAWSGRGVEASVGGRAIAVGGPALLRERSAMVPASVSHEAAKWKERGAAVLYVFEGATILGALALEDEVRPESRQAIDELHERGIRVALITGDAHQVADAVARDLGIDEVFAEVLPEDKDKAVRSLQERGHVVAMVGDGVNDAPALARADVGIAIGAGTDVAIESAGMVLASDDPRAVVSIIRLSEASYRKMVQNLGWAAGYNVFAIPLAAGVLAPIGFVLPPAVGALLMSLSTIIVALNAQLLRRLDLRPEAAAG